MKIIKVPKNFFKPRNAYEHHVLHLYFLLVENFSQTFFVGGMVRDLLLKKHPHDFDIATQVTPPKVIGALEKLGYTLDLSAQRYGIVKVNVQNRFVEITSFRSEVYDNSRYPKISFTTSLQKDSLRRDFSINSLYFQAKSNTIIDPVNGLADIQHKRLRIIGNPKKRLTEDPLRIVRAYRLASELRLIFDETTAWSIDENFDLISKLSKTRLQTEINKAKTITEKKYLQKVFRKYLHKKK